jgi:hypothetical protein
MSEEPSAGEIGRNLVLIREDIQKLSTAVEQRPDWNDLKDARANLEALIAAERTIRELQRVVADKAIQGLEDWNRWAVRIIVGAVLLGVIGLVVTVGR